MVSNYVEYCLPTPSGRFQTSWWGDLSRIELSVITRFNYRQQNLIIHKPPNNESLSIDYAIRERRSPTQYYLLDDERNSKE